MEILLAWNGVWKERCNQVMKPNQVVSNKILPLPTMRSCQSYLRIFCSLIFQCWQHLLSCRKRRMNPGWITCKRLLAKCLHRLPSLLQTPCTGTVRSLSLSCSMACPLKSREHAHGPGNMLIITKTLYDSSKNRKNAGYRGPSILLVLA